MPQSDGVVMHALSIRERAVMKRGVLRFKMRLRQVDYTCGDYKVLRKSPN